MAAQPAPVRPVAVCWKLANNSMLLIIFTCYPEAGLAKTRLIPVLGAAGPAALYTTRPWPLPISLI